MGTEMDLGAQKRFLRAGFWGIINLVILSSLFVIAWLLTRNADSGAAYLIYGFTLIHQEYPLLLVPAIGAGSYFLWRDASRKEHSFLWSLVRTLAVAWVVYVASLGFALFFLFT
jgi:hypothetical protein